MLSYFLMAKVFQKAAGAPKIKHISSWGYYFFWKSLKVGWRELRANRSLVILFLKHFLFELHTRKCCVLLQVWMQCHLPWQTLSGVTSVFSLSTSESLDWHCWPFMHDQDLWHANTYFIFFPFLVTSWTEPFMAAFFLQATVLCLCLWSISCSRRILLWTF